MPGQHLSGNTRPSTSAESNHLLLLSRMPSNPGFKWTDGADRSILDFIQECSTQTHGQMTWTSATKKAMLERLLASDLLPDQATVLTTGKIDYHVRRLVAELSGGKHDIGYLLQRGILVLDDAALLKCCYGESEIDEMGSRAKNTHDTQQEAARGQSTDADRAVSDGDNEQLSGVRDSCYKPDSDTDDEHLPHRPLDSIGDSTLSEFSQSRSSLDSVARGNASRTTQPEKSLASSTASKRKRVVADDDTSSQKVPKQVKSSNLDGQVRPTNERANSRPENSTKTPSFASSSDSFEQHQQQNTEETREADDQKARSVSAQATTEAEQQFVPDHSGDGLQVVQDPQPRVQKLKSGDDPFDASYKPQVDKVMQMLYDAIDNAVRDLINALEMDESQPVHLNSKLNFPPILGRLLCRITSEGSYIDRPQASALFSTETQLNYNLKYFLQSLIAAAVHEYCFLPAPEGRDLLLDLDNGQGYLRTALENILSPSDLLRAELEIKREFIKKDFKPNIERQAANLATEFDSIMVYILPRPTNSMCLTNTFSSMKSFTPANNIPIDEPFPAAVKQWQRNWLRDLSKIFALALNWRADGVAAGNVEYVFMFPTHRSRYQRWPFDLNEHARDIDKDPEARVVLGLMPRVLVRMREYIDRELPGEEFKVASDGMVLVGP